MKVRAFRRLGTNLLVYEVLSPGADWAGDKCDQATKGARWMSRRDEAMKDAVGCDKPRGAVKRALILGFPNGATRHHSAS